MNIVGQGLCGIVVADTKTSVIKFYKAREDWVKEKTRLTFLASIKNQGFDIGCTIPKLISASANEEWNVHGTTYNYCTKMELVPGIRADSDFSSQQLENLGVSLGTVLFTTHNASRRYTAKWIDDFGKSDELLTQLLEEKAPKVLQEESNEYVLSRVKKAKSYLENKRSLLASERSLSHIDINLPNILVNKANRVEGLVDWGALGFTNPTLSMYQLAGKSDLWGQVKKQYTKLGGVIREDILYAAATIHIAWAPIICKEFGIEVPKDDTPQRLEEMYRHFCGAISKHPKSA